MDTGELLRAAKNDFLRQNECYRSGCVRYFYILPLDETEL
jgi:hypothetical protein